MKTLKHALAVPLLGLLFNLSIINQAKADYWTNTEAMNMARYGHTATLLPNGKVLVAGGVNNPPASNAAATSSAELYDPTTGTWTNTGSMNDARSQHWATLLTNGKVLVEGGYYEYASGNFLSSAELYDPATGTWTRTGSMSIAREVHTATLLTNGMVLVAGGHDGSGRIYATTELYNPATGIWTPTASMNYTRADHTATLLPNGQVLVAGGDTGAGADSPAEIYDPVAQTWTLTGSMNYKREDHSATLLPNGQVLVAGGDDSTTASTAELYNPATGTWALTGSMNTNHDYFPSILLPNGEVLICGGEDTVGHPSSTAELFNPTTGIWELTSSMSTNRAFVSATMLTNGQILAAGGYSETGSGAILNNSSAELYQPTFPVQIAVQPQSQIGYWGGCVSFSVISTNGILPLTYQWLLGNVAILNATNSVLILTNLQFTNAGSYSVIITDAASNTITSQPATLTVSAAAVSIALYAGVTINGVVGQTYCVQSTTNLASTNSWVGLTNLTLTAASQIWYDSQPASQAQRFYRVVAGPISIP